MVQKMQTLLAGDLDGSDADAAVRFGRDGTDREINPSAGHARALRETAARHVRAARRRG